MTYIGRFAPSPSGELHYGSLLAALVSYLDAKANQGQWLLRIDDIDTPRVVSGAADSIQTTLRAHGLIWDGDVSYQSQHYHLYRAALAELQQRQQCYFCACSRADIGPGIYRGQCLHTPPLNTNNCAIRLKVGHFQRRWNDIWLGPQTETLADSCGDFIIWRKDQLCAYQLAVAVDDYYAGVNHVIRGVDLSESTGRQLLIQKLLAYPAPTYGHFPVLVAANAQKLSKQNRAMPVNAGDAMRNLRRLLELLRQTPPPTTIESVAQLLRFAADHWQREHLPQTNILWQ